MPLLQQFIQYIKEEKLFSPKDHLLLAVSGGVDSTVLCHLCDQARFNFKLLHCNFQLRGEESSRDETFVQQLAAQLGKPVWCKNFNTLTYAQEHKISIQVAARQLRYQWLYEVLEKTIKELQGQQAHTTAYIITAHHVNDNIETLLMNFFKGTGIAGLKGILPKQGKLVRPLLFARKEELEMFANEQQLQWIEDSSNTSDKYTRNYFRHQIIPAIEKVHPTAMANLENNLTKFRATALLYQQAIEVHKKKLLVLKDTEVHIPVFKLKKTEPLQAVVFEIIKDYNFSSAQVAEVVTLIDSSSGKYMLSPTHRILNDRNWLIISSILTEEALHVVIESSTKAIRFREGGLVFKWIDAHSGFLPSTDKQIATVDAAAIRFPLLLRPWKPGDYFYPLGMQKKKKLARFFIDNKLSILEKEKTWVLEADKKIIWVVGQRIDDRYKVQANSKKVLTISFQPKS
jgi:tRNA(Ile)-lysidine synthase